MLRGMVFMDHMNFDIALKDLYGGSAPPIDYNKLFPAMVSRIKDVDFLKTFIFAPQPDDFLINDPKLKSYYKWIVGLGNAAYIDVILGRYIARPTGADPMSLEDRGSYYKVEKGTDINLAINALNKAHFNAYDVAFIMSGDTDYTPIYRLLKDMGKIVVLVGVKGQNLYKLRPEVDTCLILDKDFFSAVLRDTDK